MPVAGVVLDAAHKKRHPSCQGRDLAVLLQGEPLSLK
jgi:hypothetical protein